MSAGGKDLKNSVTKSVGYSPRAGSRNIGVKSPDELLTKFTNIKDPIFRNVKLKHLHLRTILLKIKLLKENLLLLKVNLEIQKLSLNMINQRMYLDFLAILQKE